MSVRLVALQLLAAYFLVSYRVALGNLGVAEPPRGFPAAQALTWLGRWRMFTELRPRHTDLLAETRDGAGGWSPVELAALYPSRWDEGPGYLRDDFLSDPGYVALLGADVCERTGAAAVRLTEITWDKTPGEREQPRRDERRTDRGTFPCP